MSCDLYREAVFSCRQMTDNIDIYRPEDRFPAFLPQFLQNNRTYVRDNQSSKLLLLCSNQASDCMEEGLCDARACRFIPFAALKGYKEMAHIKERVGLENEQGQKDTRGTV